MQQPSPQRNHQYNQTQLRPAPGRAGGFRQAAQRRKKARRKRVVGLVVFLVLLLGLFLTALLLSGGFGKPASSVAPEPVASVPVPVVEVEPPPPPEPTREATPYDLAGIPPLFNFENPIPEGYLDTITMVDVGGGHTMEKTAGDAYNAMTAAAAEDGITLVPVSGYRTHERQTSNYNASIQRYLDQGLSQDEAVRRTEGYYAIPGTSEHEAALAMDIGFIDDSFAETEEYAWLQENCTRFGFILRYQQDTFDTTHIHWEPWHYRFVGANHAEVMAEKGYNTLEDYLKMEFPMG